MKHLTISYVLFLDRRFSSTFSDFHDNSASKFSAPHEYYAPNYSTNHTYSSSTFRALPSFPTYSASNINVSLSNPSVFGSSIFTFYTSPTNFHISSASSASFGFIGSALNYSSSLRRFPSSFYIPDFEALCLPRQGVTVS